MPDKNRMNTGSSWSPPGEWLKICTIDAHAAGEPLRVVTSGFPEIKGKTILEKRRFVRENLDHLRTALMWEPRGHADMYGCLLTEPGTDDGMCGVIFMHNDGYSTMCGHGIIGLVTVALHTGMFGKDVIPGEIIKLDTPAGRVNATAKLVDNVVAEVSFENVPSFVYALDQTVEIPGLGEVSFDLAFGGAFYAFVQAKALGIKLNTEQNHQLINLGRRIKNTLNDTYPIHHPFETDLGYLYGTIFIDDPEDPANHSRNVCVFADGELDRCPTGTGISARAAIHHARKELFPGDMFSVESILGTTFSCQIKDSVQYAEYEAVIPVVTGSAYITGRNEWLIDPRDPLRYGFILR